jgi:PhnB protein
VAKATKPIPDGYHTITPQLTLENAAQTIDWYKKAFGAEELTRMTGPDGKIMHAEIKIGDSRVMVNDVIMDEKGPAVLGGSPAKLWLFVEDSDSLFNRAVKAGARVDKPLENWFWGDRGGAVTDPSGYTWWIATHKEDLTRQELDQRGKEFFKQMATR